MATLVSWLLRNANLPMLVTLSGMLTLVSLLGLKASLPMEVTPFGMVTLVRSLPLNALSPIAVTRIPLMVSGITTAASQPLYLVITPLASMVKSLAAFCANVTAHISAIIAAMIVFFMLKLLFDVYKKSPLPYDEQKAFFRGNGESVEFTLFFGHFSVNEIGGGGGDYYI
jgi:hypothetical protein